MTTSKTKAAAPQSEEPIEGLNLIIKAGQNCENAVLTVNDKEESFDTPITVTDGQELTIKVIKEGYVNYVQKITISGESKEVTVDLSLTKHTLTITAVEQVADATITVNNKPYEGPEEFDYGTEVIVKATKVGYVDFEKTITITKDETVVIEMTKQNFTLTVNVDQKDAVIKINGTNFVKSVIFNYGTEINLEISKVGFDTINDNFVITENTVKEYNMIVSKHTLTISTNPKDSIVKLNDTITRSLTVDYGTKVNVEVSFNGYDIVNEEITVTEDTNKNYDLEKSKVNVTVKANEQNILKDAKITVGNVIAQQDVPVQCIYGEEVEIIVSEEGFKTFAKKITPTEDVEVLVEEWKKPEVSVTLSNNVASAVITINDEVTPQGVKRSVNYNSEVSIKVTADGFKDYIKNMVITEDYNPVITLIESDIETLTIIINPTPEDAVVKINGQLTKSLEVEVDSEITIEVSKDGYVTHTETFVASLPKTRSTEITKDIELQAEQFTLTVNTIPVDAIVKINNTEQKTITVDNGTKVTIEVSKEGYKTNTQEYTVTKTETISITLESESGEDGGETGEDFLTEVTKLIKANSCYTYLNCSRHFKKDGITEESLKKFYKEFGYFVMSKIDYKVWILLHDHFGHIEGIPEPEPDK